MTNTSRPRRTLDPLALSSYVVVFAVGIPSMWSLFSHQEPYRWAAAGLLATFAALNFVPDTAFNSLKVRHAHAYMAVMSALIVGLVLLPPGTPWFVVLFFVLSAEAMLRFREQSGYAWVGGFSALTVITFLWTGRGELGILLSAPLYIAGYFFFAAFATQTAHAEAARAESQRLLEELQQAHQALQEYAARVETLAVAEERNRLAREMHDTLGHRLTVASVQLQAAERLAHSDPDRTAHTVSLAREQVSQALAELRQTVAVLRSPLEMDMPLDASLRRLVAAFQEATGIPVRTDFAPQLAALPRTHQLAIYRGAQEALTNVQKHAHATEVRLTVVRLDHAIQLLVEDNGIGIANAAPARGFGLRGLRERAEQLGGAFEFGQGDHGGSRLSLCLPLVTTDEASAPIPGLRQETAGHD